MTCDTKQTAVLSVMYLSAVGFVLVAAGIAIDFDNDNEYGIDFEVVDDDLRTTFNLLFAGGFITTFFWVSTFHLKIHQYATTTILN